MQYLGTETHLLSRRNQMESALKVGINPHWEICTESWWYMGSVQREETILSLWFMHCTVTATSYSIPALLAADSSREGPPGSFAVSLCWGFSGGTALSGWRNVFEKQGETHIKCKGQQKLAQRKKWQIWFILFTWCLNVESNHRKMICLSISSMFLLHSQLSWHPIKALYKCKSVENKLGIRAVQDQAAFGTVGVCNQAQPMGQDQLKPCLSM